MEELWMGIMAGGAFQLAWNEKEKLYYYPIFTSLDECHQFWHGKTSDRKVWGIIRVGVSMYSSKNYISDIDNFFNYIHMANNNASTDIQKFIGHKEEGMWIAPSQLYNITMPWHKNKTTLTARSIRKLLVAQDGVVTFNAKHGTVKEKPINIKMSDDKWATVRAIFFKHQSVIGQKIEKLLAHKNGVLTE